MARPWAEVAADPNYRGLTPEAQEKTRVAYFEQNVAPRIPPGQNPTAIRARFDLETAPQQQSLQFNAPAPTPTPGQLALEGIGGEMYTDLQGNRRSLATAPAAEQQPIEDRRKSLITPSQSSLQPGPAGGVPLADIGSAEYTGLDGQRWRNAEEVQSSSEKPGVLQEIGDLYKGQGRGLAMQKAIATGDTAELERLRTESAAEIQKQRSRPPSPEDVAAYQSYLGKIEKLAHSPKAREFIERFKQRGPRTGDSDGIEEIGRQVAISMAVTAPSTATGIGAGALVGPWTGVGAGLTVAGAQTYAQSLDKFIGMGVPSKMAMTLAGIDGGVEAGTELLPFAKLLKRSGIGKKFVQEILTDIPGENVANYLQTLTEETGKYGDDLTLAQFREAERKARAQAIEQIPMTSAVAALQAGVQSGVARLALGAEPAAVEPAPAALVQSAAQPTVAVSTEQAGAVPPVAAPAGKSNSTAQRDVEADGGVPSSEGAPPEPSAPTEDTVLANKRAAFEATSGEPDDARATLVESWQAKTDERGAPMTLWRSKNDALALLPATTKNPFKEGVKVADFWPGAAATETAEVPNEVGGADQAPVGAGSEGEARPAAAEETPRESPAEARAAVQAEADAEVAPAPTGRLKLQRRSGREKDPYLSQNGLGFTHWAPEGADLSQYGPRSGELEIPAEEVDLIGDEADGYRALGLDPDKLQTYKDVPRLEMIKRLFERPGAKRAIGFSQEGADGNPEWEYALQDDFVQARRGGGAVAPTAGELDAAAHQAATSPRNELPEPTDVDGERPAADTKPQPVEKAPAAKAEPDELPASLEDARNMLTLLRGKATEQGRVVDDRLMERIRRHEALVKELEGATAESAPVSSKPAVSTNTIFTEDAAAKARERLRKKLGNISSGFDPEMMQDGITLAGYHLEKGARTFAAFTKAMVDDLGEAVRPYLRSWYEAVRWDPRAEKIAPWMSSAEHIDAMQKMDAGTERAAQLGKQLGKNLGELGESLKNAPDDIREKAGEIIAKSMAPPPTSARKPAVQQILDLLRTGEKLDKRQIQQVLQPKLEAKALEEAIEQAIVMRARELANAADTSVAEIYDSMVKLYGQQPNLSTRTSTSVEQQAYSTPAPLAYLASRLAHAGTTDGKVLEPTAGNGMLLMEVEPDRAVVNELNPDRAAALRKQGFKVHREDASIADLSPGEGQIETVLANPPFGTVRAPSGIARGFKVDLPGDREYFTNEIDHAIVMKALETMSDEGRAVLIIGSVNKLAKGMARSDAYNGAAKRQFFYHLYQQYNVTDQFTVAGELYAKQGASWPVDVIVIEGRGKSARKLPAADVPRIYDSWDGLRGLLTGEENGTREGSVQPGQEPGGDRAGGSAAALPDEAGQGRLPERTEQSAAEPVVPATSVGDGAEQPAGEAGSGESVGRPAERRTGPGRGGELAGAEQPADVGATGAAGSAAEQPASDGGEPGSAQGGEERPGGSSERARELAGTLDADALNGATQVPYNPASTVPAIGTLVPTNMRDATANALATLEARVGNLESYVAEQLGWAKEDVGKYLGAEQVDGVALAIDQISQNRALVVGDQTGVGKGRQVASLIRFALRQGRIPVFVTEKPNLYSDMYRDLRDIGQEDIRPLVTNSGLRLPLNDEETVFLNSPGAAVHNKKMQSVIDTGDLGDFNMVFTTYNQMQTVKGGSTVRMDMLNALGPRAMLILDESHNAGGQDAPKRGKSADEDLGEKTGRAGFVRGMVSQALGVLYSSATWAKRPDVMDLYSKTDMALAVDKVQQLPGAITRGGVPLQQAVASMLAQAGQYIRREKSFAGIEYNTPHVKVDLDAAESLSSVMLAVREFDTAKEAAVEALKQQAKSEAKLVTGDGSTGSAGAQSTNFTSVMHNFIDQMLLALKAQAAVDKALARRAEGKKVVITVSNTNGSFIGEYASNAGLKPGDAITLSFADLLHRYLEKSRYVMIKTVDGKTTRWRLTDAELGRNGVSKYVAASNMIDSSDKIARLPVSPIDYMRAKLQAAGVKTGEITGRSEMVDYTGEQPVYRTRAAAEITPTGRKRTINAFNRGEVDMLILNQAGATGLSLHASEKFKDKTQRWMVLAQAEKNIDTHMQMLGRVNRTGQVSAPGYDQLTADIPAEKRPAAVLAKKMASLNANTTAARGSAVTSKETVDFLNLYGDEVVAQLMEDMPDIHEKLGEPLPNEKGVDGYQREDAARKVTGRIPLLPVAEQEALYELIEDGYKAALAQADAMGENALEAKTLDINARTTARTVLFEGKGGTSPFAQGAWLDEVNVKRLGKPYTSERVRTMVAETLSQPEAATWQQLRRQGVIDGQIFVASTLKEAATFQQALEDKLALQDMKESERNGRIGQLKGLIARWQDIGSRLEVGHSYRLSSGENVIYGVLTKITRKKGVKLPVALGAWEAHFAVADATRNITLPFSRLASSNGGLGELGKIAFRQVATHEYTNKPVLQMFDDGQSQSREDRIIITGNLLAGFARVKGGAIVNYTTNNGEVKQGILMPRSFSMEEFAKDQPVELTADQVMAFFREAPLAIVENATAALTIRKAGSDFLISVPKSRTDGGKFYLDRGLTDITKDFSSKGDRMIAAVSSYKMPLALQHLQAAGEKFSTKTHALEARLIGGKQMASTARIEIDDDSPMADLGAAAFKAPVTNSVKRGLAIRAALDAKFGPGSIKSLIDKGVLRIVATFDNLPADVQARSIKALNGDVAKARDANAWMDPKSGAAYIVAANTDPRRAATVLLHEIGEHYGLRNMLGEDAYHRLHQDVKKLRFTDPAVKAAWEKTEQLYVHEHPGTGRFVREVVARLADDPSVLDAPWFKRVLWAVRRFLWSKGLFKVDADDIRAMLASSLRKVMDEPTPPRPPAKAAPAQQAPMASLGSSSGNNASWDAPEPSRLNSAIRIWLDPQRDIKRAINAIQNVAGELAEKLNPYLQEELYHSRVTKRVRDFIQHEVEPLTAAMSAEGVDQVTLGEYMANRHAEEANELVAQRNPAMPDGGSGIYTADARQFLAALEPEQRAKLERLAAMTDAVIEGTRETIVAYGLESVETIDGWREQFRHYVPLHREDMDNGTGLGKGYSVRGPEAMRRHGSLKKVELAEIFAHIITQREKAIVRGEKNRIAKALYALAKAYPNAEFWKLGRPGVTKALGTDGKLHDVIDMSYKDDPGAVVAKIMDGKGNIVERTVIFNQSNDVAKHAGEAFRGMDVTPEGLQLILDSAGRVTRFIGAMSTQYSPEFVETNFIRDFIEGGINLQATALKGHAHKVYANTFPAIAGIFRQIRSGNGGKWGEAFEDFALQGGPTAIRNSYASVTERSKELEKAIKAGGQNAAWTIAKYMRDLVGDVNEAIENGIRLATYQAGIENGITKAMAASLAKNLTVNFDRRGQAAKYVGPLYVFFNAAAQGTATVTKIMVKTEDGKPVGLTPLGKRVLAASAGLGVAQAVLLAMAGFDEDEPPAWVKNTKFIVPVPGTDSGYISIPMPHGYRAFPGTFRLLTEHFMKSSGDRSMNTLTADLMKMYADSFNPLGSAGTLTQTLSPTVVRPAVDLELNLNFAGREIAKEDFSRTDPTPGFTRVKGVATPWGQWISHALNTLGGGDDYEPGALPMIGSPTPDQIDHLIEYYLGGPGRFINKTAQTARAVATGEELPAYRVPFVGVLYGKAAGGGVEFNRFYNNLTHLNILENGVRGRRDQGLEEQAADFAAEHAEVRHVQEAHALQSRISKMRKARNSKLAGGEREEARRIDEEIVAALKGFNDKLLDAKREDALRERLEVPDDQTIW